LADVGSAVATLTKSGNIKTIYRFGQSNVSDAEHWFHWTTDVDVARSQIPGDTSEWTFFTGDGIPKATYSTIALSGTDLPTVSRPLGTPAPDSAATVSAGATAAVSNKLVFYASTIEALEAGDKIGVKTGDTWSDLTVVTATPAATVTLLNTVATITASVNDDGDVDVTSSSDKQFFVRYQKGVSKDTEGTFTYGSVSKSDTGESNTYAYIVIDDTEIGSVSSGDVLTLETSAGTHVTYTATGTFTSASAFATALASSGALNATVYGSCVVVTPGSAGSGTSNFIKYKRVNGATTFKEVRSDGSENPMAAFVILTKADVDAMAGKFIAVNVNGAGEQKFAVPSNATVRYINSTGITTLGLTITFYGTTNTIGIVQTGLKGTFASVSIKDGDYPEAPTYSQLNSVVQSMGNLETRVYTYTLVTKESGYDFESGPAPASNGVDLYASQEAEVTGFADIPAGYSPTHRRIYRSVSGVYLFVAEIAASATSYTDDVLAEDLGEELPTLTWAHPPADLRGLINLPNGIMAGFVGRDVYFCDPGHPHAWPLNYQQSLDFPIIGLGRMDTTLAVITTGSPYFIQGSHPDSMVVVKSGIEQSGASKRSIVSANGVVLYASPDGLVQLSPGGSKVVTEQYFTYAQWQQMFKPSSIHAYMHDLKYVAFYDNGTTQGGFIYDTTSGQFVMHDIYAVAGYADLLADKLYLAFSDKSVKIWQAGSVKSYVWTSKKFSLPHPAGFSCAQLEAETYPVTLKFYVDGSLGHTQTVADRKPFRLPVMVGRDWELRVEGSSEVFSVAVAQSMEELAGV